jgi:hypothetical protein
VVAILKKYLLNNRGNTLVTVAFIIPILVFCMHYLLTWGMAVYCKSTVVTAAREAARAYAVYNDEDAARAVAKDIVQRTVSTREDLFDPERDILLSKLQYDGNDYCSAKVVFRVPVAVPNLPKLINPKAEGWGDVIQVGGSAVFKKEPEIPEEGGGNNEIE